MCNKWNILKGYISNRMHTGANKKSTGAEQPFLENEPGMKRNTKEGDTCENQFEGQILRIKYAR